MSDDEQNVTKTDTSNEIHHHHHIARQPRRHGFRFFRFVIDVIDILLFLLTVGFVIWSVGTLVHGHYLPLNPITGWVESVGAWEQQFVMSLAGGKR